MEVSRLDELAAILDQARRLVDELELHVPEAAGSDWLDQVPYCMPLASVERHVVLRALTRSQGNRCLAAKRLGISIRGLRNKLQAYAKDGFSVPPAPSNRLTARRRLRAAARLAEP